MPPQFQSQFTLPNNTKPPENPVKNISTKTSSRNHAFLITLTVLLVLVGAFGIWYFSKPLPEEEPETMAVVNKFANWQTYRNEEYGFEFKYPMNFPNFEVKPYSEQVIQNDGEHTLTGLIFFIDEFRIFAIEIWPRNYFDKFMVISSSSSNFAEGIVWDKKYQNEPGPEFISKNNNFAFAYSGSQDCPEKYCSARAEVAKIISTFKFISTSTPTNSL